MEKKDAEGEKEEEEEEEEENKEEEEEEAQMVKTRKKNVFRDPRMNDRTRSLTV